MRETSTDIEHAQFTKLFLLALLSSGIPIVYVIQFPSRSWVNETDIARAGVSRKLFNAVGNMNLPHAKVMEYPLLNQLQ